MAEVAGLVLSSLELVKTARELKKLVSSVKTVPGELDDLLKDLQVLIRLLSVLEEQQAAVEPFTSHSPEWQNCRNVCRNVCDELSKLVTVLKTNIERSGRRGAIRAVLKKDAVSALQKRLEKATSNLMLANQIFQKLVATWCEVWVELTTTSTLHVHQMQLILKVPQLSQTISQLAPDLLVTHGTDTDDTGPPPSPDKNAFDHKRQLTGCRRRRSRYVDFPQRRYLLQCPPWLLQRVYEIQLRSSKSGWDVKLRQYMTVPDSAAVFQYAAEGDVEGLRVLFDQGLASVNDHSSTYGETALHIALRHTQPDAVGFLLNRGADATEQALQPSTYWYYWGGLRSCLGLALLGLRSYAAKPKDARNHTQQKFTEIVQLLTSDHDYDEMIDDPNMDWPLFWTCHHFGQSIGLTAIEVVKLITRGYDIAYQNQPFIYRRSLPVLASNIAASEFWMILGFSDFDKNTLLKDDFASHAVAVVFEKLHADDDYRSGCTACCHLGIDPQGWLEVLRKLACALESRWALIDWRWFFGWIMGVVYMPPSHSSPWIQRIRPRVGRRIEVVNSHLQSFASMLAAAGMTQNDFMALERHLRQQLRAKIPTRIINLDFGARLQDCKVWIADSLDEWSGEFWIGVEEDNHEEQIEAARSHLSQPVPGSWIPGDDTDDEDLMQIIPDGVDSQVEIDERDLQYFSESRRRQRRLLRYLGHGIERVKVLEFWGDGNELDLNDAALEWSVRNQRRADYCKDRRASGERVVWYDGCQD